jgi:hypothetical protein
VRLHALSLSLSETMSVCVLMDSVRLVFIFVVVGLVIGGLRFMRRLTIERQPFRVQTINAVFLCISKAARTRMEQ